MAEQIASLFVAIGANLAGLNEGLSQAQSKLKTVGDRMGSIGRGLTAAVTLPLVGIGVASVKMAADFEQQMALAQLSLRDTGVSMETVSDYALKMGADTIFNAQEMALALTGLGKAGLNWEEIAGDMSGATGVLAAVTNLAAASNLELAQAADVVTVAMATFGRPAEDAVDIVDNLVMAADASVAEVSDLSDALASAGPVMASFGWDMEDVVTALALLSERGIRGSDAGTALRSMMTNLMRPTDQVKDALGLLNVNLYDSENRLKALPELIGELSDALTIGAKRTSQMSSMTEVEEKELKRLQSRHDSLRNSISDYQMGLKGTTWTEEKRREKIAELQAELTNLDQAMAPLIASSQEYTSVTQELTEEQRNQLIQTLAGTYGMRAMTTLLEEGTEGWEGMTEAIGEGATAQEVADIMMDTLKGRIEELKGSVETLAIKVGGTLSPIIKELVDERLLPLVDVLGGLDEEQMAGLAKLGLVIAGIGPGLLLLSKLPVLLGLLTIPLGLVAIGAGLLGGAWYMATDEGIKFRTALRGLSGELKKEEGTRALGVWIDKITDFLDALERLWIKIEAIDKWMKTFKKEGVEPSIITEPMKPAIPGMPTAEETWGEYSKGYLAPEFRTWGAGVLEWMAGWLKESFATGLEFVVDLVTPEETQVFADEEVFQAYLDQMKLEVPAGISLPEEQIDEQLAVIQDIATDQPIEVPLNLKSDTGKMKEEGRKAGRAWKSGFDEATGSTTGGAAGWPAGGIMDELWAGGVAW